MSMIGVMAMPANFRYREVFLMGRPRHETDPFGIRHPKMDRGHRAKIFSPFDALKGFSEAVQAKTVLYEDREILSEDDAKELDRRLSILHNLTYTSRMARRNRVRVRVTYYVPCSDRNHEAYGFRGQYVTVEGICYEADEELTRTLLVDELRIPIEDVVRVEPPAGIFEEEYEDVWP